MTNFVLSKKITILAAFWCVILGTAMQAYGQSNTQPSWMRDFPPEDELWGIGVAKLANSRNSMSLAELRARAAIVRQISGRIIQRPDDDEFNNLADFFIEYISMEVSFEIMNATKILRTWKAPDGTCWCLISMHKSDVLKYASIIEKLYQEYLDEVFN